MQPAPHQQEIWKERVGLFFEALLNGVGYVLNVIAKIVWFLHWLLKKIFKLIAFLFKKAAAFAVGAAVILSLFTHKYEEVKDNALGYWDHITNFYHARLNHRDGSE